MPQGTEQNELQGKTQLLLNGPLKHVRAAALAAALLPLASVAATPAAAEQSPMCGSGGICGFVWNDTNNNGFQDSGETGIEGAKVYLSFVVAGVTETIPLETGPDGQYSLLSYPSGSGTYPSGSYTISVRIPTGMEPSPSDAVDDTFDSDGGLSGAFSTTTVEVSGGSYTDFGFFTSAVKQPGTGTPGYWKNHPDAWPVQKITVGGTEYTKAQAISWLGKVGKDKLTTMFSSLVPAKLNVMIGNQDSCVAETILDADAWMAKYGPLGLKTVLASSAAWAVGEPMHMLMDAYNNGLLCAKHRN